MIHRATPAFWQSYRALPVSVQELADRAFHLLEADPRRPSLHFKGVGSFWSARVGLHYRAISIETEDGVLWFWIGSHPEYDCLVLKNSSPS